MIKQDEELDRLEEDIRILKNKYDQFFGGRSKLPPLHERRILEVQLHELSRLKMRDNGRRFRFNTLLTRYNQYREMWSRKMREREEGPLDFRRRAAAMNADAPPAAPVTPEPIAPPARPPVTSGRPDPYVKVAAGSNGDAVKQIYEQVEKEHLRMGKLPSMTLNQLAEMVERQTEALRARYNVNTIAFRVETVDGKVKLKAKPLQDG